MTIGKLTTRFLDLHMPGAELGVEFARESHECEHPGLELAGVGGAFAGLLPGGPRAEQAQAAGDLGLIRAAGHGTVERLHDVGCACARHQDDL
jgi:hypothetical protein